MRFLADNRIKQQNNMASKKKTKGKLSTKAKSKQDKLLVDIDKLSKTELRAFLNKYYKNKYLTSDILGKIFEKIANPNENGYSNKIYIKDLVKYHYGFQSSNGCSWARTKSGYLGRKYIIDKPPAKGRVVFVQLCGFNEDATSSKRYISPKIRKIVKKDTCCITDVMATSMEVDHKNALYDDERVANPATQVVGDFQHMSKAVNDAKREHCNKCKETGIRYAPSRQGYIIPYIKGDECLATSGCEGCYLYDPVKFNQEYPKICKELGLI